MSSAPVSDVVKHQLLDEQLHAVLLKLKAKKAALQPDYLAVLEEEYIAVIQAAMEPEPNFRSCPRPEAHKLTEQFRVICTAVERIETLELPANTRFLEAARKHEARIEEINQQWPTN